MTVASYSSDPDQRYAMRHFCRRNRHPNVAGDKNNAQNTLAGARETVCGVATFVARSLGIDSVVYSIGYLGDAVRAYVGDGSPWGVSVAYVDEGEHLRGTAGALRLALDCCVLDDDFLVLYGDSWLQVDPAAVLRSLRGRPEPALMTVHRNEDQWDSSNVIFDGHRVVRYGKGLGERPPEMCWIDYGLTALRRSLLAEHVPPHRVSDLAPVL